MSSITLKLEHIGNCYDTNPDFYRRELDRLRVGSHHWKKVFLGISRKRYPWVAEVSFANGLDRSFLDGKTTYEDATRSGDRGVCRIYHLFSNRVYEVRHFTDWDHEERYFCIVKAGQLVRLSRKEAIEKAKEYAEKGSGY